MPQSAQGPASPDGAMGRHALAWVDTQNLPTLPGLQACRGCILAGPVCAA